MTSRPSSWAPRRHGRTSPRVRSNTRCRLLIGPARHPPRGPRRSAASRGRPPLRVSASPAPSLGNLIGLVCVSPVRVPLSHAATPSWAHGARSHSRGAPPGPRPQTTHRRCRVHCVVEVNVCKPIHGRPRPRRRGCVPGSSHAVWDTNRRLRIRGTPSGPWHTPAGVALHLRPRARRWGRAHSLAVRRASPTRA